ncbi:hypothetical protein C0Q70_07489 [Pomacea canaliculata]|uniref:Uncharacterized protein n=1 Tax=Pomacea canaliculata TaxID=400727 RepID=A0A2T7PF64_POMCA|nr:hypothetical protein C0Q70_07489 [Pomacea canaliculata]
MLEALSGGSHVELICPTCLSAWIAGKSSVTAEDWIRIDEPLGDGEWGALERKWATMSSPLSVPGVAEEKDV